MKKLALILIILAHQSIFLFSQDRINVIIFIDNQLVLEHNISKSFLIIGKEDSIHFEYELGRGLILKEDGGLGKLEQLPRNTDIQFCFVYFDESPKTIKLNVKPYYFLEKFICFSVYDFSKKRNKKIFSQKLGYGYDAILPSRHISLPRKNKRAARKSKPPW